MKGGSAPSAGTGTTGGREPGLDVLRAPDPAALQGGDRIGEPGLTAELVRALAAHPEQVRDLGKADEIHLGGIDTGQAAL